jgi:hypothetical protein
MTFPDASALRLPPPPQYITFASLSNEDKNHEILSMLIEVQLSAETMSAKLGEAGRQR